MEQGDQSRGVKFEEEQLPQTASFSQEQAPKVVQWVIRSSGGYIKSEVQASYVLIGFVVIALIVSFLLVMSTGSNSVPVNPPGNI